MKFKDKLYIKILNTVTGFNMLGENDSVLISISGGPDSVFLAHFLNNVKERYKLKLYGFHLDHMTRGGQSGEDAAFVEALCRNLGIVLFLKKLNVKEKACQSGLSFQDAARNIRLNFLGSIAKENEISKIAVGHTADDNIETFFMHLFRGSGLGGLAGIKPVDKETFLPETIIRPLINISRHEISEYLHENGIDFRIDRTNLENIYFRNRIRNVLIPFIKENISTGFEKRLLNTIEIIKTEDDFLKKIAMQMLEEVTASRKTDDSGRILSIEMELGRFSLLHEALKRRVIILAVEQLKGSLKDLKSGSIGRILKYCYSGGESRVFDIGAGIRALKELDRLFIFKKNETGLKGFGTELMPIDTGSVPEIRISEKSPPDTVVFSERGFSVSYGFMNGDLYTADIGKILENEAFFDFSKIDFPVSVRFSSGSCGEKFYPLGLGGSKKLHDFLIDKKVPKSKRKDIPVFYDKNKIIWVGGLGIDDRVKLNKNTKKIFFIKINKI
jgi:tRNA(Ile)-lysidine synthase